MQDGYITGGFNALNQPVGIWSKFFPGGESAPWMFFGYDPLGRCVKRWIGPHVNNNIPPADTNPATYFYYDGWNLIQEGPSGFVERTYVHGSRLDEIVASVAAGAGWLYHHYDARGHCILQTNATGALQEQYDYDAFGWPYFYTATGAPAYAGGKPGSPSGNRFLFTGREWIKHLRLYDYRNRMYQPELGRFLQPDPIQFKPGDYNLYRYCHNDPINKSDPTGLQDEKPLNLTSTGRGDWDWFNGRVALDMQQQRAPSITISTMMQGDATFSPKWGKPTGNYDDPNPDHHVKSDAEMGGDDGQTWMSQPKVAKDGSVTSELNWWVKESAKLTAVSLAEIKDHVRGWRNWQDDEMGDGYSAFHRFKATGSQDARALEQTLRNAWVREHYRQKAEYDNSQRHSTRVHPELKRGITPKDIERAINSLP